MSERMSQAEIDALIASMMAEGDPAAGQEPAQPAPAAPDPETAAAPAAAAAEDLDLGLISQAEVEEAIAVAEQNRPPAHPFAGKEPAAAAVCEMAAATSEVAAPTAVTSTSATQALLLEIGLTLTVELGRTRMALKDVLMLAPGAVITLDSLAADPVSVKINNTTVMKAEVVVMGEHYGVRLTEARLDVRKAS